LDFSRKGPDVVSGLFHS